MNSLPDSALFAVAWLNGLQETLDSKAPLELWTLVLPVTGLTVGSTYVRRTIESALAKASLYSATVSHCKQTVKAAR